MPPVSGSGPPTASTYGWIAGWIVRVDPSARPPRRPFYAGRHGDGEPAGRRDRPDSDRGPRRRPPGPAARRRPWSGSPSAAPCARAAPTRPPTWASASPARSSAASWATRRRCRSPSSAASSSCSMTSARSSCRRSSARSTSWATRPSSAACPASCTARRSANRAASILYLHGGGYIGTSPQMYAFFTARVCRETGCAVFVADYRLAPEFPYPAGDEDATAVYERPARPRRAQRAALPGRRLGRRRPGQQRAAVVLGATPDDPPRRAHPLLARGRPAPRRALGHRERQARHPALEHPHRELPARRGRQQRVHLAADRRPRRLPAHLRGLGRRRDVPRPHPALRRPPRGGRRAHPRPRVRGHVPRLPDPHALGREEPAVLRPPRRPSCRSWSPAPRRSTPTSCATCRPPARPTAADLAVLGPGRSRRPTTGIPHSASARKRA